MGRTQKIGVDYFPHFVASGRTMYTLESRFGNDGYAFWFKLLELLSSTAGHFIDCKDEENWMYLVARSGLEEARAVDILETLARVGAIDKELWSVRTIWSQNLVDNFDEVYQKRKIEKPKKPDFRTGNDITPAISAPGMTVDLGYSGISGAESTQRKVKESKGYKRRVIDKEKNAAPEVSGAEIPPPEDPVVVSEPEEEKPNPRPVIPRLKLGEFKNVFMSPDELGKLEAKLTPEVTAELIERLSAYMQSHGKRYKSHYATVLSWAMHDQRPSQGGSVTMSNRNEARMTKEATTNGDPGTAPDPYRHTGFRDIRELLGKDYIA